MHSQFSLGLPLTEQQQLDLSRVRPATVAEAPDETFDQWLEASTAILERRYGQTPDTDRHPAYQTFATVEKDGTVLASVDNHGYVTSGGAFTQLPDSIGGRVQGPVLAEARAAYIAGLTGGTLLKQPTALDQAAFETLPKPQLAVDMEGLRADPMFAEMKRAIEQRNVFLAEQEV